MAARWEELIVAVATGGSSGAVVSICVFTAVLCLCLVAGHLLEENKWVNESITALLIVRLNLLPPSLSSKALCYFRDRHAFTSATYFSGRRI